MKRVMVLALALMVLLSPLLLMSASGAAQQQANLEVSFPAEGETLYIGYVYEIKWDVRGASPQWQYMYLWTTSNSADIYWEPPMYHDQGTYDESEYDNLNNDYSQYWGTDWYSYLTDWSYYYEGEAQRFASQGAMDWSDFYSNLAEVFATKALDYSPTDIYYGQSGVSDKSDGTTYDQGHYQTDYSQMQELFANGNGMLRNYNWEIPEDLLPGQYALILGVYDPAFETGDGTYNGHWISTLPFTIDNSWDWLVPEGGGPAGPSGGGGTC